MVCKMVNAVAESGNYWVANNFIWGWLLVPVSCMAEIIKKNNLEKLTFKNTWVYALGIAGLWIITIPGWRWFITNAMAVDATAVLNIVYPALGFYFAYIASAFIDAWFISKGKTIYIMINSMFGNLVYYGIVYILFKQGVFTQNMGFVIMMFGCGLLVHLLVSIGLYLFENEKIFKKVKNKKQKILIGGSY